MRKLGLVVHVGTSVGWVGAALAFLVLAVAASTADDPATIRGSLVAMGTVFWFAIVPLALGTVAIAVLQSLLSPYGLLRHWWVVVKLLVTLLATAVVISYGTTMTSVVAAAGDVSLSNGQLRALALSPLLHATLGIGVLLVALVLSVYKPSGLTPIGWRWQDDLRRRTDE